ncbi:MAG TPA: acetyl-CoA carboxylase biotin carboxyl carrier protein [Roseiarcus sp.]|nr:acetyl-CoA carboxylase biotin carboxyl carrier protein [Roseiarcus sp.]
MKKPLGQRSDEPTRGLVDLAAVDQLAIILSKYDLSEVEIDIGELHVRLARERASAAGLQLAEAPPRPAVIAAPPPSEETSPPASDTVKSPMVGTAYLRSSPDAKPFVEIGSMVKTGDKLLLIEAMKTFNDILAPRAGKVLDILVADGSPVEYDQPLMVIE